MVVCLLVKNILERLCAGNMLSLVEDMAPCRGDEA